ncbi:hypothetical protein AAAC51_07470 [Priestia megaterium]
MVSHQVTLKQQENTSFLINPACSISFNMPTSSLSNFKRIPVAGQIDYALNTNPNQTFQEVWLSKTEGPADGYVELTFDEIQKLNRFDVGIHTVKPIQVYVEYTLDQVNFYHLPYYPEGKDATDSIAFHFPTTEIKKMRIWIRKQESDKEAVHPQGYSYQYLFGIKKIQFFQLSYPANGEVTTKLLTPNTDENFSIGKVTLVTEEEIPDGTDIEYYIRTDEEETWKPISPTNRTNAKAPNMVDFKYVVQGSPTSLGIAEQTSSQEAEIIELQANGISFYSLGTIEKKKILPRTERLYIGKDAWNVQSVERDFGATHIPAMSDWNQSSTVTKNVLPIKDGNRGVLLQEVVFTKHTQQYYSMGIYYEDKTKYFQPFLLQQSPLQFFLTERRFTRAFLLLKPT